MVADKIQQSRSQCNIPVQTFAIGESGGDFVPEIWAFICARYNRAALEEYLKCVCVCRGAESDCHWYNFPFCSRTLSLCDGTSLQTVRHINPCSYAVGK